MAYLFLAVRLVMCPAPAAAASTDTVTATSTSPVTIWGNQAVLRDPQTGNMVDVVREKPAAPLPAAKKQAKKKKKPAAAKPPVKKAEAKPAKRQPPPLREWGLRHLNCQRFPVKLFPSGMDKPSAEDLAWKPEEPQAPTLFRFGNWHKGQQDVYYEVPCGQPGRLKK